MGWPVPATKWPCLAGLTSTTQATASQAGSARVQKVTPLAPAPPTAPPPPAPRPPTPPPPPLAPGPRPLLLAGAEAGGQLDPLRPRRRSPRLTQPWHTRSPLVCHGCVSRGFHRAVCHGSVSRGLGPQVLPLEDVADRQD